MSRLLNHNPLAGAYRAISLFSGAGGCSLGFHSYGVSIISAYDIWDKAVETYNANFPGNIARRMDLGVCDFNELRESLCLYRGELDLIIGGPPCQGFSTSGKRGGEDPRNRLLQKYVNAIDSFWPRWFMMENVEGMLTTSNGDFIVSAIEKLIELGYSIFLKKVYMHEYGVPQCRKRVIVVGNREGKDFSYPQPEISASGHRFKLGAETLMSAIGDLEDVDIPSINHIRKTETGLKMQRILSLSEGQSMKDLPPELQHKSFVRRSLRRVSDGMPSEKRGGAPSGLKRLVYDEPSLTVTGSSTSEFIHPRADRMLTVRECARIQTFPDGFVFCGTDAQQEQQIGNAIPPLFANIMAEQILKCDCSPINVVPNALIYCNLTKSPAMSPALSRTFRRLQQLQHSDLFGNGKTTKSVL